MAIVTAVTGVFSAIGDWFVNFIPTLLALFWTPAAEGTGGQLTILGVLAICGLAISVFFLVMGLIQNFLHFRG